MRNTASERLLFLLPFLFFWSFNPGNHNLEQQPWALNSFENDLEVDDQNHVEG